MDISISFKPDECGYNLSEDALVSVRIENLPLKDVSTLGDLKTKIAECYNSLVLPENATDELKALYWKNITGRDTK